MTIKTHAMNFAVNHIQHVGIPVTDLKRSERFYETLGFSNVMSSAFDHKGEKGIMAMMQRGGMIMELYQFPDSELAEIGNRRDGHVDHIAFDVDDIDETFALLKKEGFTVVEGEPVFLNFWDN